MVNQVHVNGQTSSQYLDPKTARDVLSSYDRRDGLSMAELMDDTKHGGLTYNDILVLPGRISFPVSAVELSTRLTRVSLNVIARAKRFQLAEESRMMSIRTTPSKHRSYPLPWTASLNTQPPSQWLYVDLAQSARKKSALSSAEATCSA